MPPDTDQSYQAVLAKWPRLSCALVGVASAVTGAVATFHTSNSAGSGVLLGVGALFLYMGTTGVRITKARVGNTEFGTETVAARLLNSEMEEVRVAAAEAVTESDIPSSSPLRIQASAINNQQKDYEREVLTAISTLGAAVSMDVRSGDMLMDGLATYKGRRIGVEVKLSTNLKSARVRDAILQCLGQLNSESGKRVDAMLIVANTVSTRSREMAARYPNIEVAEWNGTQNNDELQGALDRLT